MIRHICMFTLKEDKAQNKEELVSRAQSLKEIAGLRRFEVVTNKEGTPESNYDVSLILDFDDVETLDAYQKDPVHVKFAEFVGSVKEGRACIDYEF